jgi:hypothetical protein
MSLRKIAKILGISPAYLSLLVNGRRRWGGGDFKERYLELVNTQEANTAIINRSRRNAYLKCGRAAGIRTSDPCFQSWCFLN